MEIGWWLTARQGPPGPATGEGLCASKERGLVQVETVGRGAPAAQEERRGREADLEDGTSEAGFRVTCIRIISGAVANAAARVHLRLPEPASLDKEPESAE